VTPVLLGRDERLFDGVPGGGLELVGARATPRVTHLSYAVRPG
jgi:hypothetical protein